jgi:hypothetical protein
MFMRRLAGCVDAAGRNRELSQAARLAIVATSSATVLDDSLAGLREPS